MGRNVLVLRKFTEIVRGEGVCLCNYFQMAQKKRERGKEQKGRERKEGGREKEQMGKNIDKG